MASWFKPKPLALGIRRSLIGSGAALALLAAAGQPQAAVDVEVSGYVKGDFIYDADEDLGDTLNATAVPTGDADTSDGTYRAHARQSRFRIKFDDEEAMVRGRIEGDFFSSDGNELISNSRHYRLRHAFFSAGSWTFGQTWSVFMDRDFVAYGTTVDFAGPAGVTFIRQPQVRYTNGGFDIALENPEVRIGNTGATDADGSPISVAGRDTVPDLTARYAHTGAPVAWFVAGVLSNYEVAGGAADGETASSFGAQAGIDIPFGSAGSVFGVAVVNGGRYTYYSFAQPQAVVDGDSLETVDSTGASIGINLNWGGAYDARSTLVFGTTQFDDEHEAILGADSAERLSTVHANYRWNPYQGVDLGIEVSVASRENFSGDDGDATRVQFGARYSF